jgi:two-component system, OmpR family, response regulator
MQDAGHPLPRKILEDTIWGADTPVSRGVLDTLINSLRGKLDAHLGVPLIKTMRGLGYCLQNGPEIMRKQNT